MARQLKNRHRKKDVSKAKTGSRHSTHLLRCVLSVLFAAGVVGGLTLLAGTPSKNLIEHNPNLNAHYPMLMEKAKPEIVLLGNSMLGESVDERLFMQQTGLHTLKLWKGGWASATWYLAIKNVIIPADPKPQAVVIFFRDHSLTDPGYRVRDRYKEDIDKLSGTDEPLLERLAYLNAMNPLTYWLNQNWSLIRKREDVKGGLESNVKSWVGSVYGHENGDSVNQSIEQIFGTENLLAGELGKAQLKSEAVSNKDLYDFEKSLPVSFLPTMVQLARDNDVKLVFVRVKRRREAKGVSTPAGLDSYIRDMGEWLEQQQVPFIDFSGEARLKLEHYADGDHLNQDGGRVLFTQLLTERLKPHLVTKADSQQ